MPRTVNRSADAAITSTQSSSEKSEFDNVSVFSSLCSLERSSFACIRSTRHRMDLKSAIIVCVSKSAQDIRWMTMCWVVDMNLCRVMSSIETTSASSRHLSNLRHVTQTQPINRCCCFKHNSVLLCAEWATLYLLIYSLWTNPREISDKLITLIISEIFKVV